MSVDPLNEPRPGSAPPESAAACFHCGLPVPTGADYRTRVLGEPRDMCCPGCQAVAQAIVEADMEEYYRHRTEASPRPDDDLERVLEELSIYDRPEMQKSFVANREGDRREASLILEGIVCAACIWLSERHVRQLPGVESFSVNFTTHRAQVVWDNTQVQPWSGIQLGVGPARRPGRRGQRAVTISGKRSWHRAPAARCVRSVRSG